MPEESQDPMKDVRAVTLALNYAIPWSIHPGVQGGINVQFDFPDAHDVVITRDPASNRLTIGLESTAK